MKRIILDLDGTITIDDPGREYPDKEPNCAVIDQVRRYHADGYAILIYTARNMNSYNSSIGLITAHTVPSIVHWLNKNRVPFNEVYVGKPWCGPDGFYVDDKAIRPDEFISLSSDKIQDLLGRAGGRLPDSMKR